MELMGTLAAVTTSVKSIATLAKAYAETRDEANLLAQRAELLSRIVEALGDLALLRDEADELKRRVVELEHAKEQRERYALHEYRPGVFLYKLREESMKPGEPPHYCCPRCMEAGQHRTLQLEVFIGDLQQWGCTECEFKTTANRRES